VGFAGVGVGLAAGVVVLGELLLGEALLGPVSVHATRAAARAASENHRTAMSPR
jgi:hypothetical protein